MFAKVPVRFATYVRKSRSVLAGGEHYLIYPIPFPSNVRSSFLQSLFSAMDICMCKCFVVQGLKYQASIRFNQFQAQIFFAQKEYGF